jgi:hypothetical protein
MADNQMDFLTLLRIMLRRWIVVVPVLVVTAAAVVSLSDRSETQYSTSGSELLVTATDTVGSNLSAAIAPDVAGPILTAALNGAPGRQLLAERDLSSNYTVQLDPSNTVLTATVTGNDRSDVLETGQAVLDEAPNVLGDVVGPQRAESVRLLSFGGPRNDDIVTIEGNEELVISLVVVPAGSVNNPFPPNASTVRTVTALAQRPEVAEAVQSAAGRGVAYSVSAVPRDTAPIINVLVSAAVPGTLPLAYDALVSALDAQLAELQSDVGVAEGNRTVLASLVPPAGVQVSSSSVVRSAAGVAILGLGIACVLAVALDAWAIRRRRRINGMAAAASPEET